MAKKQTENVVIRKLIDNLIDGYSRNILKYTPQLFTKKSKETSNVIPCAEASGVLIEVENQKFLITAGHFLEDTKAENIGIMIDDNFIILNGTVKYIKPSQSEEASKIDIAVWKLEGEVITEIEKKYTFLPFSQIDFNHKVSTKPEYLIVGFPWRMTKEKKTLKKLIVSPFIFLTKEAEKNKYKQLGFQEHSNLLLKHRQKKVKNLKTGFVQQNKSPQGASGCGVWHIPISNIFDGSRKVKLIGQIIEQDDSKTILISTRIHLVAEVLRRDFKLNIPASNITRLV